MISSLVQSVWGKLKNFFHIVVTSTYLIWFFRNRWSIFLFFLLLLKISPYILYCFPRKNFILMLLLFPLIFPAVTVIFGAFSTVSRMLCAGLFFFPPFFLLFFGRSYQTIAVWIYTSGPYHIHIFLMYTWGTQLGAQKKSDKEMVSKNIPIYAELQK